MYISHTLRVGDDTIAAEAQKAPYSRNHWHSPRRAIRRAGLHERGMHDVRFGVVPGAGGGPFSLT